MVHKRRKIFLETFQHGFARHVAFFIFFTAVLFTPYTLFASNRDKRAKNAIKTEKPTRMSKGGTRLSPKNASKSTAVKKLTASGLYQKSKEYFDAGKFPEAIQYAAAAQRRTTATRLPTVLVAQSYYRLGNSARAAKLFLTVPLSELPRSAAVDYLFSMYAARRYLNVIKVFPLIAQDHPYRDVARYYLGASYLQLKLYQKATANLRASKKIPSELKAQRRQLLAQISRIRQQERQGEAARSPYFSGPTYAPVAPPPVEIAPPGPVLPGGTPAKPTPLKQAPPKVGFAFSIKPGLDYKVSSERKDYNGYNLEQSDSQTPKLSVALAAKYLGEPKSFGGQPELEIGLTPSSSTKDSKSSTSKLVAEADNPSNIQNVTTRSDSKTEVTDLAFSMSGLMPISDAIDIGASYDLTNTTTKKTSKSETTDDTIGVQVSGDFDAVDFTLSHDITSSKTKGSSGKSESSTSKISLTHAGALWTSSFTGAMSENDPPSSGIKSRTDLDLSLSRDLGDFDLELGLAKFEKQRIPLKASGSSLSETSAKGEVTYSLDIGLSASVSASIIQVDSLPIAKDDTISEGPEEVMASGTAQNYVVTVKYSPISFASASVSYDYSDRVLKVGDPAFKLKMLKENWSQKTSTSLKLSLSYTF